MRASRKEPRSARRLTPPTREPLRSAARGGSRSPNGGEAPPAARPPPRPAPPVPPSVRRPGPGAGPNWPHPSAPQRLLPEAELSPLARTRVRITCREVTASVEVEGPPGPSRCRLPFPPLPPVEGSSSRPSLPRDCATHRPSSLSVPPR